MRYWLSFRGPFGTRPGFSVSGRELAAMGCKAPAVSADGALGIFKRDTDNALFLGVVNRNGAAENRAQKRRRVWMWLFVAWLAISAVFVAIIAANADERLHDGSPCFNDYGEPGHWYGQHCYVDTDGN